MNITESEIKKLIDEELQAMIESGEITQEFIGRLARGAGRMARRAQGALQSKVAGAIGADDMAAKGKAKQVVGSLMGPLEDFQANAKKLGLLSGAGKNQDVVDALKTLATVVKAFARQGNLSTQIGGIQQGYRESQENE